MNDKERIIRFLEKLIPDDFMCGSIAVTFNDDGSLFITVSNKEQDDEKLPNARRTLTQLTNTI